MKKAIIIVFIVIVPLILAGCSNIASTLPIQEATIYKSGGCGCCSVYSQYMDGKGFETNVINSEDGQRIKQDYGIPLNMQSCHTTTMGNYFIEGHMPMEAIEKLFTEQPDIAGIALPGMPSGSPGMPGAKLEKWVVYAVHKDGRITEFMQI